MLIRVELSSGKLRSIVPVEMRTWSDRCQLLFLHISINVFIRFFFYKEDLMLAFAKYGAKFRVRTFSNRFASEQKSAVHISGTQKNPIEIAFAGTTSEENPQP